MPEILKNPMQYSVPVELIQADIARRVLQKAIVNKVAEGFKNDQPFAITGRRLQFPVNESLQLIIQPFR